MLEMKAKLRIKKPPFSGNGYVCVSGYSSKKIRGDEREYTWVTVYFRDKLSEVAALIAPGDYIEVTGFATLKVKDYKGTPRLDASISAKTLGWVPDFDGPAPKSEPKDEDPLPPLPKTTSEVETDQFNFEIPF